MRGSHIVPFGNGIYGDARVCDACGTYHLTGPCSKPCVCRCRQCDARLDCRGVPEDWPKPLNGGRPHAPAGASAVKHRADAYCPVCGGTCRDPEEIAAVAGRPILSLRPSFTGPGQTSFKPARHANRGPGK